MTFRLKGEKEAKAWLARLAKLFPAAAARALYEEGVSIGRLAQEKSPVESGELESSMYVTLPEGQGRETRVEVGFTADYAIIQHERTDFVHQRGGPKFLERAGAERAAGFLQRVARRILDLVRGGSANVTPQAPTGSGG